MLIKRTVYWKRRDRVGDNASLKPWKTYKLYVGWFLFGIIPLIVWQVEQ